MNYATLKRVYEKNTRPMSGRKHLTQFFAGTGGGPWSEGVIIFFMCRVITLPIFPTNFKLLAGVVCVAWRLVPLYHAAC